MCHTKDCESKCGHKIIIQYTKNNCFEIPVCDDCLKEYHKGTNASWEVNIIHLSINRLTA